MCQAQKHAIEKCPACWFVQSELDKVEHDKIENAKIRLLEMQKERRKNKKEEE